MNILDFYKECESKYEHLPLAQCFNKDDAEKILQDAKPGALLQLETLFGKDEKLMFYMLQYLLVIPSSIELHKNRAEHERKKSKKISQKKSRFQKKIEKQVEDLMSLHSAFNPDVDNDTLKKYCLDCLKTDKGLRLEAEILNDTIKNWKKGNAWQGKTNPDFKQIIYNTYIIGKRKSYILGLLDSLNLKTPQGKPFTKDNIKHYCKTPSR